MIEREIAALRLGDEHWHDGAGWYYTIDDYEDEGSCGAFSTLDEAAAHAIAEGYEPVLRGPHPKEKR